MNHSNVEKIYAFDYLRAICCVIVVVIHTNLVSVFSNHKFFHDLITYYLLDLAVPIFFQTSLILFFINRKKQEQYFLKKRLFKLVKLYVFWGLCSHIFYLITANSIYSNIINGLFDLKNLVAFILQDGYSNPFYFFFSLLFLTTLAEIFAFVIDKNKMRVDSEKLSYISLIISCVIIFLLPSSVILFGNDSVFLSHSYNPLNFVPYVFSAFLISKSLLADNGDKTYDHNNKEILMILLVFLTFAFCEENYFSNFLIWSDIGGNSLPIYSRVSLVFGSWLLTLLVLRIPTEPNFFIKLFSSLSLGIYCLHTFFIQIFFNPFPLEISSKFFAFFIVLFLSTILTKIFKSFRILQDVV